MGFGRADARGGGGRAALGQHIDFARLRQELHPQVRPYGLPVFLASACSSLVSRPLAVSTR